MGEPGPKRHANVIDEVIDGAPLGALQYRVAALCAIVAMLDGFDTQAVAFVAPVLGEQWGVSPDRFGLVFAAGLLGIMVGQLSLGMLSDRFGRRPVIIFCTALFGIFSFATIAADGWVSLLILRFLTGIGLGGATPNVIALTAEIAPPRARGTMITIMFAGFPLGAAIGGYASSILIPAYGWQIVFILGGVLPSILLLALLPWLSESPHYLFQSGKRPDRLRAILEAIAGRDTRIPIHPAPLGQLAASQTRTAYAALFAGHLKSLTLPLWIAYFLSLLMIYFLMSWLPTIVKQGGLALDTAIISSVFLNLGGALGGIILGGLADRVGAFRALTTGYLIAGISLALIGVSTGQPTAMMALVFVAGLCTIGGQTAMNAATAAFYPARIRATALGAALAVGRAGSIVGPTLGGLLLASQWSLAGIFLMVALPAFLTAGITLFLSRSSHRLTSQ